MENEQAQKYKEDLINARLDDISTKLQIDYENIDRSVRIEDLNIPKEALMKAIYDYEIILDVKAETKYFFELYKSLNPSMTINLRKFRNDRRKITMKINFIINRLMEIAELYNKFIKVAIKYVKMLKTIEDPDLRRSPKLWKDVNIEDRAELIKFVNDHLTTCIDLLEICKRLQPAVLNATIKLIDVFKLLKVESCIENFVKSFNELLENEWQKITMHFVEYNIDIMSDKLVIEMNPIYMKLQKHYNERDSFESDIRKWEEHAYSEEVVDNFDNSVQILNDETTFDNLSVREYFSIEYNYS